MLPPSGPEKHYLDALKEGRFEIQKCAACGRHVFYPRVLCPHCGSAQLGWTAPSGRGVVYSTTVVRRKPADGGDYNVCLVDLVEGVRMMSRVVSVAPTDVKIGMAVKTRIADGLVEFTPA
ncbi:MAG: Zn-ribbon domain-containing OB-fold protein [Burkholderiales bacterium]